MRDTSYACGYHVATDRDINLEVSLVYRLRECGTLDKRELNEATAAHKIHNYTELKSSHFSLPNPGKPKFRPFQAPPPINFYSMPLAIVERTQQQKIDC